MNLVNNEGGEKDWVIADNPKKEALYTVSAIPKGQRQYALEVTSSKDNTGTTVEVNWIAIQMKEISVS